MGFLGVPLGWLMWLMYSVINNYGLTLLLFTLLIKLLLFPLSIKQQKSTAKMAVFQPRLTEIQKKYANNPQKQQEELSKFYQEHGYNPMSGCLPMVATFIVLFGIIEVVYNPLTHILRLDAGLIEQATEILKANITDANRIAGQIELQIISAIQNPETVSWFTSLGTEFVETIKNFDYTLLGLYMGDMPTFAFNWLLLIPILSGATSFAVSYISMKMAPANQQAGGGMMKGMMYMMPIMSLFITFRMPVGVGIYWIFSNILAGVQTVVLHYMYNPERYKQEYARQLEEDAKRKREEREKRRQAKLAAGQALADEDLTDEELAEKQAKKKKKKEDREAAEKAAANRDPKAEYLSEKERNRRRLAEARRLDAEKYGEEYVEVTDEDLK